MLDYESGSKSLAERERPAVSDAPRPRSSVTPGRVIALALRNKLFILAVALACAAGGYALTKLLTPRYVAAAQIYLDPRGLPGLEGDNQGQDSTGFINFVETQTRILTSQVVLERVVEAEKLTEDPEFGASSSFFGKLFGRFGRTPTPEENVAGAVRALGTKIIVRRPERTFIIDIAATSDNPQKSARIANAVAQAYIDVRAAMHSDAAHQAATSFTGRLDGLRERLLVAEKAVEAYKAENGFVGTRDSYIGEQRLKELNQQLTFARTRLEDTRSRFEQAQRAAHSDTELAAIAANMNLMTLNALRGQQAEAAQKLADLSAELGPQHPVVKNATARLAETRRLVSTELARVAASLRKDYERARGTEEALNREMQKLEGKAVVSAQASVKLRDLEREVEVSRTIYESFLTRSRQTGEARQLDAASTHIITMATPPIARSFPPGAGLMTSAGFVGGLTLGLGLAFLRERGFGGFDPEEGRRRDMEAAPLRVAVTDATKFTVRGPSAAQDKLELTRLGIPFVRPFADRRELEAVVSRLCALVEESAGRPLVVGLVGDAPGSIRTVMAVNIALALRLQNLEVALVDADRDNAALTVLIEDGLEAFGDADDPFVRTDDSVLLALPAIDRRSRAGAVERIVDGFRNGRPAAVDIVLCDGVGLDETMFERLDWVAPVLGRDQDEEAAIAELPEPLRAKIALILRVDHSDPWLPRRDFRRRSEARKTA
ncbi:GumC family protein [Methylosinus sp. H3A]|uniref:GumC family protein n=1 Tax=Methylosinus sp. H3A TaxID=2785786 RepID=UPI0018C252C7|nr:GumC family protein [Methylosinus sp. H3A]MBG0811310.1 GumC family protein [Methylosinus sp. H3A]